MTYDPFDPFNEVPMYFDFFLRFNDEAEANAALFTEQTNVQGDTVETVLVPKYAAGCRWANLQGHGQDAEDPGRPGA